MPCWSLPLPGGLTSAPETSSPLAFEGHPALADKHAQAPVAPVHDAPSWSPRTSILTRGVAFCLLLNFLPMAFQKTAVTVEEFPSSHHVFHYALTHHWRFGIDLIDNVGPLGIFHYPVTYLGEG